MSIDKLKELVVYGDLKDLVYKLNIIDVTEEILRTLLDLTSVYYEVNLDDVELKLKRDYLTKLIDKLKEEQFVNINMFKHNIEECYQSYQEDDVLEEHTNTLKEEHTNTLKYEYVSCDKDTGDSHVYDIVCVFVTVVELTKQCECYIISKLEKYLKNLGKLTVNDVDVGKLIFDLIDNEYLNDICRCTDVINIINVTLTFDNMLVVKISDNEISINLKNKDFKELTIVNDETTFTNMTDKELIKHVNDMYVKWYSDNIFKTINTDVVAKKEVLKPEYDSKYNTVIDIGDPYDMTINIITDEEPNKELNKDIYKSVSEINEVVSQHIPLESLVFLNVTTLLLSQTSNFNDVTYVVNTSTIELTCEYDNIDEDSVKLTFLNKKDDTKVVKLLPVKENGFLNVDYIYNAFSTAGF